MESTTPNEGQIYLGALTMLGHLSGEDAVKVEERLRGEARRLIFRHGPPREGGDLETYDPKVFVRWVRSAYNEGKRQDGFKCVKIDLEMPDGEFVDTHSSDRNYALNKV